MDGLGRPVALQKSLRAPIPVTCDSYAVPLPISKSTHNDLNKLTFLALLLMFVWYVAKAKYASTPTAVWSSAQASTSSNVLKNTWVVLLLIIPTAQYKPPCATTLLKKSILFMAVPKNGGKKRGGAIRPF